MKRILLLGLLLFTFTVNAQEFDSTGNCKASFEFAINPNIYTFAPATAIDFFDKSEGEVIAWFWDFGDNNTSTEQNPMYIFNHPLGGSDVKINPYRNVRLTITTKDSCISTTTQTINIIELPGDTTQNCLAVFKYYESDRDTSAGTVTFQTTNYSEGEEISYFWQFGDGSTSTEKEPALILNMDHQEYKVCLTVFGVDSCASTMCQPIYLEDPIIPDTVQPECIVDFRYDRKDILMNPLQSAVIDFYSKSYPDAKEWYWDFGDGTSSNEPKPSHAYILPYNSDSMKVMYNPFRTVCLTVITENDCKVSTCQTIQIFDYIPEPERCKVYFKYYQPEDVLTIPEMVPIQLVDVSEGDVISRYWQFEDGTFSTEKEPLVSFNVFQPVHKVCLTVTFADSCINTFCDAVYVNNGIIDTIVIDPVCPYYIKVDGGFPIQMSSCSGWASANIYLGDELVKPTFISWSNGDTLSKVEGLCPTETYSVKALMPDGCVVKTDFILSADGSITTVSPINWWLSGEREKLYVRSDVSDGMIVEWRLCDGTIVEADSIPLDAINCGGSLSNMIIKDSLGNVVYSENIMLKGSVTGIEDLENKSMVKLWPNPVSSTLNIKYSGKYQPEIRIEICDIMGRVISTESFSGIYDGFEYGINTELLKQGIYICRISTSGKTISSEKFSRR